MHHTLVKPLWLRLSALPPLIFVCLGAVWPASGQDEPAPATGAAPHSMANDRVGVHDPVIAKEDDAYYVFRTGRGVSILRSTDRENWDRAGRVIDDIPAWVREHVPDLRGDGLWAPDISYFNGNWHLYYSASSFGSRRSAIGLATSPTLDPEAENYGWTDRGMVVSTTEQSDHNAIDPNVVIDAEGRPWMSYGSYWSGIKLIRLDPATGKPAEGAELLSIAARPEMRGGRAVEAPFIFKHDGWFYQFVSFDRCCIGERSTYNIRVGRSRGVTGPYLDRDGATMTEGGGTLVLEGGERWRGPGHNAVFNDEGVDWLVYHAYDAQDRGRSKLRIDPITWDDEGWPTVRPEMDE